MSKLSWPRLAFLTICLSLFAVSCGGGGSSGGGPLAGTLEFSLSGLPDLKGTGHYEAWIAFDRLDGQGRLIRTSRSLGKFTVFGNGPTAAIIDPFGPRHYGDLEAFSFEVRGPLAGATVIFITFEQVDDRDGFPSRNIVLSAPVPVAGAGTVPIDVDVVAGAGLAGLTNARGAFTLFSPTDRVPGEPDDNPEFGVWFVNGPGLGQKSSLLLPSLPAGWVYEGWVAGGGDVPGSLGRFRDPRTVDSDHGTYPGRGTSNTGPKAPGQDFVNDVIFPEISAQNLVETPTTVTITVEPDPDNNLAPFQLEVLTAPIPMDAVDPNGVSALTPALDLAAFHLPSARAFLSASPDGVDTHVDLTSITLDDLGVGALDNEGEVDQFTDVGVYGLWAIAKGEPQPIGQFRIIGSGAPAIVVDPVDPVDPNDTGGTIGNLNSARITKRNDFRAILDAATEIFITIESSCCFMQDDNGEPPPSPSRILSGMIRREGGTVTADLSVQGAIVDVAADPTADLRRSKGSFFLATPTDDLTNPEANDAMGIWFPELDLPPLRTGWIYEGFVEAEDESFLLSTGKFTGPLTPDRNRYTSRTRGPDNRGFFFPGEDFVTDAPEFEIIAEPGLVGTTVFLTIEPEPDNSPDQFFLQILNGQATTVRQRVPLANVAHLLPSGTVSLTGSPSSQGG